MSDIPIIKIDTEQLRPGQVVYTEGSPEDEDELLRWDAFCKWASRILAVLGAGFLILTLAASAGYWWARYGEREWIEASTPVAETPCGSCRKGGAK